MGMGGFGGLLPLKAIEGFEAVVDDRVRVFVHGKEIICVWQVNLLETESRNTDCSTAIKNPATARREAGVVMVG